MDVLTSYKLSIDDKQTAAESLLLSLLCIKDKQFKVQDQEMETEWKGTRVKNDTVERRVA